MRQRKSPLLNEQRYALRDFARLIRKSYNTVLRWRNRGSLNRDTGKHITLDALRGPSGLETSMEAYDRFIEKLNSFTE